MSQLRSQLRPWAICPRCLGPYAESSCPRCEVEVAASTSVPGPGLPAPPPRLEHTAPLDGGVRSGAALGGLTLGALGIVPLLGLAFCMLGVVLSLAALRASRWRGRDTRLAYAGLAVSLATSIPGILIWGWLRSASAAW